MSGITGDVLSALMWRRNVRSSSLLTQTYISTTDVVEVAAFHRTNSLTAANVVISVMISSI